MYTVKICALNGKTETYFCNKKPKYKVELDNIFVCYTPVNGYHKGDEHESHILHVMAVTKTREDSHV